MANEEIRWLAKEKRVMFWEIAAEVGISEATLTRWMRIPLSKEREQMIVDAIERLGVKE